MKKPLVCLLASFVLFACTETAPTQEEIPWSEVAPLVASCKVETVYQGHDRRVALYMRDGTQHSSRSPHLDDILTLIDNAECKNQAGVILE